MDTKQIYSYLHSFLRGSRATFDVIPCDYLNEYKFHCYPLCLVVNTGDSSTNGEHWVALFKENQASSLKFIDSYGLGIDTYNSAFKNFAVKLGVPVVENTRVLQNVNSQVCGEYAIYFIYKLYSSCCLMSIYCHFSKNTKLNDLKVKNFVRYKLRYINQTKSNRPIQCCTKFK